MRPQFRLEVLIPSFSFCRSLRSCDMDSYITIGGTTTFRADSSNHYPERRRQHFDRPALQRQHLAVHHHVHWPVELKVDPANRLPLRQRMPRVRAIVKRRQVPYQPQSPDWPPAHVLDQSVVGDRVGRDHHCATRELAVVKRQKQAAPRIKLSLSLQSKRERAPIEPRQA